MKVQCHRAQDISIVDAWVWEHEWVLLVLSSVGACIYARAIKKRCMFIGARVWVLSSLVECVKVHLVLSSLLHYLCSEVLSYVGATMVFKCYQFYPVYHIYSWYQVCRC